MNQEKISYVDKMFKFLQILLMIAISKSFRLGTHLTLRNRHCLTKLSMISTQIQPTVLTGSLKYNPKLGTEYIFVGGKGGVGKTSTSSGILT